MVLSKDEVKHIAKLARIELNEDEINIYSSQLTDVLSYIDILKEVDTSNIPETDQVTGLVNVVREDKVESFVNPDDLLRCSELPISDNQIKVKKVM